MATTDNSYVNKLNPAPYSQAVFLTQKVINNSFSLMWQLAQTEPDGLDYSKKNPLKWFDHHNRSGEFLKFQVGKPTVSLQITTKDPMLYVRLHMVEGEVFLYLTNDPEDNSSIKWEFKNWTFAFSVKIGKTVHIRLPNHYNSPGGQKESKLPKTQKNTGSTRSVLDFPIPISVLLCCSLMHHVSVPYQGFYQTLNNMFDTTATTKWSPKLSDFGNKKDDWRNLSDEAKTTFENFIHAWLTLMKNKGTNILGYSAEREREDDECKVYPMSTKLKVLSNSLAVNKYAPTFPPTSIDYFCYPWQGVDGTQKRDNDLDTNALSYLMMSNFQDPPASGGIDYSGAWVDQDRDATFVMSRDLFWPWLQSLLREVVIGMVPYPKSPVCYYDGSNPDLPFVTMLNFKAGDDAAKPSQYHFTKLSWKDSWLLRGENRSSKETAVNGRDAADKMILTQECMSSLNYVVSEKGLTEDACRQR